MYVIKVYVKKLIKGFGQWCTTEMCGATLAIFGQKLEHFRETIDIGTLYITVETLCQIVFLNVSEAGFQIQ